MKSYVIKNWKTITLILIILGLILFNVKQYQGSQKIVKENDRINLQYQALLEKENIYNLQIADYKTQINKKDSAIISEKEKIEKTEDKLQISQSEARRLSAKIKNLSKDKPEDLQNYVKKCDSLATVAPVLADQVDTLKKANKDLVNTMEEKSKLQDSIISKKDTIISQNRLLLANTLNSYNKATEKLVSVETKLNKEKKRKSFWKKTSVVLGAVLGGIIVIK